jgi:hypothetical protein
MKPKLLLRIAAVLMLLHTVGHTLGAITWNEAPNAAIGRIITAMQTDHFLFMGRSVTIASFYEGYGYSMIVVLLLITVLLWFLSNDAGNSSSAKYFVLLTVFLLSIGIIEYFYFFLLPAAFSILAGLCVLFARINLNSDNKQVLQE